MSANRACAMYGITMTDLQAAKVECQWRSTFGNPYAVVKISDVESVARTVKAKKAADEAAAKKKAAEDLEKAKVAEFGREKWEAMKKAAAEAKVAEEAEAKRKAALQRSKEALKVKALAVLNLPGIEPALASYPDPNAIPESNRIGKSQAKTAFGLNDTLLSPFKGW